MLYDVITKEGIIKLCDNCSRREDSPIIRKPTVFQLKEIARSPTVYERLSKVAGIDSRDRKPEKKETLINQETNLRLLVDQNYTEKARESAKPRSDLIDNFHWIIMRVRRSRKLTQKELAEAIGEPEAAIKMAEQGVLPNDNKLLNKIENYLKIDLSKERKKLKEDSSWNFQSNIPRQEPAKEPAKETGFGEKNPDNLTISELKKLKEEILSKRSQSEEKENKDLSEEEIRRLIFKK